MKIMLADYGVGNLHSIKKALEKNGASVDVVNDMKKLLDAKCIVFPGVGAFDKTMEMLLPYREIICDRLLSGVPALGICIGTQIMFESSEEGKSPGLSIFPGKAVKLKAKQIPHMGWNQVVSEDPLMDGIADRYFYFAHSYYCEPKNKDMIIGETEYEGNIFPSFFRTANVYGTQFHPEKSGDSGLQILNNFINFAEDCI
ncbi:MAG: imidazole glycerol phosphate synthase subunit HisH [Candidatus Cloacimonetes bacterium]|nr:imidazole glycerol phosphate synthase subunit HisH [Candidatus Cloacimonadota bacterium]MDD3379488.1 imidazole glycerol phosphate synthase subunit HisH [Candidatus Methanomethylophilaceae archaeon]